MRAGRPAGRVVAALVSLTLVLAACAGDEPPVSPPDAGATPPDVTSPAEPPAAGGDGSPGEPNGDGDGPLTPPDGGEEPPGEPLPDPAEVGANELGQIPVLMYHRVVADGGGDYDVTPEQLRAELRRLHDEGYRPIRTVDLADGTIDVPAGTTPVVLTFDDSSRSQFAYTEDGGIDPDSAVGILLAFAEEHPDFPAVASFYVNGALFGVGATRGAEMLRHLHELGFEIGNHGLEHVNLGRASPADAQRDLALGADNVRQAVPGHEPRTLSLPFGVYPTDRELAHEGSHDGIAYRHDILLRVGAGPSVSPFHREFDPMAVPRIRSQPDWSGGTPDYGSGFWLDILASHPERRYVSDGDPDRISFPAALAGELADAFGARANPYG